MDTWLDSWLKPQKARSDMNLTKNLTEILVCRLKKSNFLEFCVAVSLDRSIIVGLVQKEGVWSKISHALHTRLLTQAPPY